jgi:prepilin-type N-terminal cleavage/methylation domain-containing protein
VRHTFRKARGFTLIELVVVLALVAVIAAVTALSMSRARPRATLGGAATELRGLLHQARQQALVSGADVWVMIFPGVSGEANSLGRVVVYQDALFNFFNQASAVHFGSYDPLALGGALDVNGNLKGEVIESINLPRGVVFGPAAGMGTSAKLVAPFDTIPVTSECTFCLGAGAARRGAVVFDYRGRARFYGADGQPSVVDGGSISLTAPDLQGATPLVRLLAITATTGSLQSVNLD